MSVCPSSRGELRVGAGWFFRAPLNFRRRDFGQAPEHLQPCQAWHRVQGRTPCFAIKLACAARHRHGTLELIVAKHVDGTGVAFSDEARSEFVQESGKTSRKRARYSADRLHQSWHPPQRSDKWVCAGFERLHRRPQANRSSAFCRTRRIRFRPIGGGSFVRAAFDGIRSYVADERLIVALP